MTGQLGPHLTLGPAAVRAGARHCPASSKCPEFGDLERTRDGKGMYEAEGLVPYQCHPMSPTHSQTSCTGHTHLSEAGESGGRNKHPSGFAEGAVKHTSELSMWLPLAAPSSCPSLQAQLHLLETGCLIVLKTVSCDCLTLNRWQKGLIKPGKLTSNQFIPIESTRTETGRRYPWAVPDPSPASFPTCSLSIPRSSMRTSTRPADPAEDTAGAQ